MSKAAGFLTEVIYFFLPLGEAVESVDSLQRFFRVFGHDVPRPLAAGIIQAIQNEEQSLANTMETVANAIDQDGGVIPLARDLFAAYSALRDKDAIQTAIDAVDEMHVEVFDYLARRYLGTRAPLAIATLQSLGVQTEELIKTEDFGGRDFDYLRIVFNWSRLGTFVRNTGQWAEDVYGWGKEFRHQPALARMALMLEASQLATTVVRPLDDNEINAFLANHPGGTVRKVSLPFVQSDLETVDGEGRPEFNHEAGLSVVPFGDVNKPENLGFAIAPYIVGEPELSIDLTDNLKLDILVDAQATGGRFVTIQPSGFGVLGGGTVEASFEFAATYSKPDNASVILLGDEESSNIRTKTIHASAGGSLTGDFYVAGGFGKLAATIDFGEDGFLGSLLSAPVEIEVGDILMGWRAGRGVYFEGGTGLSITVPLDLNLGPLVIDELDIGIATGEALTVSLTVMGDVRIGPVFARVGDVGLAATLVEAPDRDGLFGRYEAHFNFIPPTEYALSIEAGPITGGGLISVEGSEYRGALALSMENVGFSAFAILNTELPDGRDGFSLAASLFGSFSVPLPFGFFLTGIGGVIGINRTIDADAMRDALLEGQLDSLLFPADPIASAATVLDDMAEIIPPREGQHLFGPVARIDWGQPSLVEVKLGIIVEIGGSSRLMVLGRLSSFLPDKRSALVALNTDFFGEVDFAAKSISFDASLQRSRILNWAVSGDVAIRTGWAERTDHIASFGGLHPEYPRPANLPSLRRMTINFGTNNPRITLTAYQAVTLSSLQFGARGELYAKGPKIWLVGRLAAEGHTNFDALIYFNPFAFDVALSGALNLLVDGDVVCGLGFRMRLTGPNTYVVDGKVWVKVFGKKIDFKIKHTWGERQSLPEARIDGATVLREVISASTGLEPIRSRDRSSAVGFRPADDVTAAIDPLGGACFTQQSVPLGISIDKIGSARLMRAQTFDLKVFDHGGEVNLTSVPKDFVRGHFFELDEDVRLRGPVFAAYHAGFEFETDELMVDNAAAIEADYAYEIIKIPRTEKRNIVGAAVHLPVGTQFADRFMNAYHRDQPRPAGILRAPTPDNPIFVADTRYVPVDAASAYADLIASPGVPFSFGDSASKDLTINHLEETEVTTSGNPAVADYVAAAMARIAA